MEIENIISTLILIVIFIFLGALFYSHLSNQSEIKQFCLDHDFKYKTNQKDGECYYTDGQKVVIEQVVKIDGNWYFKGQVSGG